MHIKCFKVFNTISFHQNYINWHKLASNITLKNYISQYFSVCPILGVSPRTVITSACASKNGACHFYFSTLRSQLSAVFEG